MPILQSKKQSDLEKRLRLLRQQVYGKIDKKKVEMRNENQDNQTISPQYPTSHFSHLISNSKTLQSDITYLRQDLLKILILSSSALGIQIILFILSKNHILNLKFF